MVDELSSDFLHSTHWDGMGHTVALRFAKLNSHVFAAEKTGRIRLYQSIDSSSFDYDMILDISERTYTYV